MLDKKYCYFGEGTIWMDSSDLQRSVVQTNCQHDLPPARRAQQRMAPALYAVSGGTRISSPGGVVLANLNKFLFHQLL